MFTILVNDSHKLVVSTPDVRIMQNSKNMDTIHFLVPPKYEGKDMSKFTVCLEYILPVSHKFCTEILTLNKKKYKGYLEYRLPMDTQFTQEVGDIQMQLSFAYVDLTAEDTNAAQKVRKTDTCTVTIYPVLEWSTIVPDSSLDAIDQRLIKMDALMQAMDASAVNGLKVKDNKLSLTADGKTVGNSVDIVVPKINDGLYDGEYNGLLELDDLGDLSDIQTKHKHHHKHHNSDNDDEDNDDTDSEDNNSQDDGETEDTGNSCDEDCLCQDLQEFLELDD